MRAMRSASISALTRGSLNTRCDQRIWQSSQRHGMQRLHLWSMNFQNLRRTPSPYGKNMRRCKRPWPMNWRRHRCGRDHLPMTRITGDVIGRTPSDLAKAVQSRSWPKAASGRVEMWRGSSRFGLSVAASFVWRCPNNLALTPFPHPAHRTGHADLPHPALGQDITPSHTAGSQPWTSQTHETEVPVEVLGRISPAPATSHLVFVA